MQKLKKNKLSQILEKLLLSDYFVLYLSIVCFLILWLFIPVLGSQRNIENIFSNMWPLLAIAIGQMFVLLIGGIDLSQVGLIGFLSVIGSAVVCRKLNPNVFSNSPLWGKVLFENGSGIESIPLSIALSILIMLLFAVLIGLLNGLLISKFKMPNFMVTLVFQMLLSAVAIFLTASENITGLPDAYITIGNDNVFSVFSIGSFIVIAQCIAAHFILSKTKLGKWIYAVGMNPKASRISGIPNDKIVIFVYIASAFSTAIGTLLYTTRMMAGRPTLGATILMDIIGATVIGGTSMYGGKGKVTGTIFGVLFFVLLGNVLNHMRLNYATINIVKGAAIMVAAYIDVTRMKLSKNILIADDKKEAIHHFQEHEKEA